MSSKAFRTIPPESRPRKIIENQPTPLYNASGGKMVVTGKYRMEIDVNGTIKDIEIFVSPHIDGDGILGIDGIRTLGLGYDSSLHQCRLQNRLGQWKKGQVKSVETIKLAPLQKKWVSVRIDANGSAPTNTEALIQIDTYMDPEQLQERSEIGAIYGPTALIKINQNGTGKTLLHNCLPHDLEIPRGRIIGTAESLTQCTISEVNKQELDRVIVEATREMRRQHRIPISAEKRDWMKQNTKLNS